MNSEIDIKKLKGYPVIKIIGHKHADFDSITSGCLLEYIFNKLGIKSEFVLQDGIMDTFFKEIANKIGFDCDFPSKLEKNDILFLVDHTAKYKQQVVGCIDHHPTIVDIKDNYIVNKNKTSCAKLIYEWGEQLGIEIPEKLTILTIYSCYMDSCSFKSTKVQDSDRIWCESMIEKFKINKKDIEHFGYGITDTSLPYEDYIKTGLKEYPFKNKKLYSSYIVTDKDFDLYKAQKVLQKELNNNIIAWCFIVNNVKYNYNKILVITKEYYLIHKTANKLHSRGNEIIPALMRFLSFENDGRLTKLLIDTNTQISTMESCTSGLVASNITDYDGSSAILKGSDITYSNEAKIMSGVSKIIINEYGVYSKEVSFHMARCIAKRFNSNIGVGVTGTIGNTDPANKDSTEGEVFYTIYPGTPIELRYNNIKNSKKELKQKTTDIILATIYSIITRGRE